MHTGKWNGDWVRTLSSIADRAHRSDTARKRDLGPGDRVIVSTKNSVYCLHAVGGDQFVVSGGWFEKHDCSRLVTVNGCTFGGSAICTDLVAAPGLFIEFGNRVFTTRVRQVRVVRHRDATPDDPNYLPN